MPGTARGCHKFPDLVLQSEVLDLETIVRRLLDGTLDLGFIFEAPQLADLEITEVFSVPLVMVSTNPHNSVSRAMRDRYIMVDWGTSFSIAHAQQFPGMPPPSARMGLGRMAREFLLGCGGTAYLARSMVSEDLREGRLFPVPGAAVIERKAYAVYPVRSQKSDVTDAVLSYFGMVADDAPDPAS